MKELIKILEIVDSMFHLLKMPLLESSVSFKH